MFKSRLAVVLMLVLVMADVCPDNNDKCNNPPRYAEIKASFTFVLDGNFTAQPIKTGESEIVKAGTIDLAKLRNVSLEEIKQEYGIEFVPSTFDGYSVSSLPYPSLFVMAPIVVSDPYSVVSLYDSTNDFSNDFDRATDRPAVLLTEYAVGVSDTVLAALSAQGIHPTYGGRYGTVITQQVMSGDVISAGAYNITQVRYDDKDGRNRGRDSKNDPGCRKKTVTKLWALLSRVPARTWSFEKDPAKTGTFSVETFRTYSPDYGYGSQLVSSMYGPLINGTMPITYRNHVEFPDTFGVLALPIYDRTIKF